MPDCEKCGSNKAYWSIKEMDGKSLNYCDDCYKKYDLSDHKKKMEEYHNKKKMEENKNFSDIESSQNKDVMPSKSRATFTESDNLGTRHDSKGIAMAYWMGERRNSTRKDPFVMFTFNKGEDARNALLELPCIHVACDTQNLICTERLIFGHFAIEDVHEAILCGDALTVELWEQASASFAKHGGQKKNDLVPTRRAASIPKAQAAQPEKVIFVTEDRKSVMHGTAIYRVYKGPDEPSAMAWLQNNPVTQNMLYLVVETPEGNFCRDSMGIYKEDA